MVRRTPLFQTHVSLGGRMVPFAGWEMPIQFEGILDEARSVRSASGLFDVSHMGRLRFTGRGAAPFLHYFLSANVLQLATGRARYHVICNEQGGIIDDAVVYRLGEERFLLVVNAANTATVLDWLGPPAAKRQDMVMEEITAEYAMIAFQGPQAAAILEPLSSVPTSSLRLFSCAETQVAGKDVLLARTGYTGEDGFEFILPQGDAEHMWRLLVDKGAKSCGLGARDVLRLEASLLLSGTDMDTSVNPFEAGLERFVYLDKEDYVAGPALQRIKEQGLSRRLVGFRMVERGIPRHDYSILDGQERIGQVTSGGYSPTLDSGIGLGYVPTEYSEPGTRLRVDIRGRATEAVVVSLPFYSRRRSP